MTLKPAEVAYYVDADLLGLAKVIAALRPDITYPGDPGAVIHKHERPVCPITSTATPDEVWIPKVAAAGWLIITRDRRIQHRPAEIAAVLDNNAKMVALSSRDARTKWLQLQILMANWHRVEALTQKPGPFVYTATRTSFVQVAPAP